MRLHFSPVWASILANSWNWSYLTLRLSKAREIWHSHNTKRAIPDTDISAQYRERSSPVFPNLSPAKNLPPYKRNVISRTSYNDFYNNPHCWWYRDVWSLIALYRVLVKQRNTVIREKNFEESITTSRPALSGSANLGTANRGRGNDGKVQSQVKIDRRNRELTSMKKNREGMTCSFFFFLRTYLSSLGWIPGDNVSD